MQMFIENFSNPSGKFCRSDICFIPSQLAAFLFLHKIKNLMKQLHITPETKIQIHFEWDLCEEALEVLYNLSDNETLYLIHSHFLPLETLFIIRKLAGFPEIDEQQALHHQLDQEIKSDDRCIIPYFYEVQNKDLDSPFNSHNEISQTPSQHNITDQLINNTQKTKSKLPF